MRDTIRWAQLCLFLLLILLWNVTAQVAQGATETKVINYDGQPNEFFELSRIVKETRFRTEQREGVCTRQVPYQERECTNETRYRTEHVEGICTREIPYQTQECNNVTRYRQECHTIPGEEECTMEQERRCQSVTRYREECRMVGGGQDCRREGGEETCQMVNGRRVCTRTPVREICTPRPERRVCERVPYLDEECSYHPRRVCRRLPDRQDCRQIPYEERVCQNVTRHRTENYSCMRDIQVPYEERVCRNVTRHRNENYACMRDVKVPYEIDRHLAADVEFVFNNSLPNVQVAINCALNERGEVVLTFKDNSERRVIISGTRKINRVPRGDELRVDAKYRFDFLDYDNSVSIAARNIEMKKMTRKKLEFVMGRILDQDKFHVNLVIESSRDGEVIFSKDLALSDMKISVSSKESVVKLNLVKLIGKKLDKMTKYNVRINAGMKFEGEILNYQNLKLRQQLNYEKFLGL